MNEKANKIADWALAESAVTSLRDILELHRLYPDDHFPSETGTLERALTRLTTLEERLRAIAIGEDGKAA